MSEPPLRIVIVDGHPASREALRTLIGEAQGMAIVGEAPDADMGVKLAADLTPDLVILGELPQAVEVETTRRIAGSVPSPKVLVLTRTGSERSGDLYAAGAALCLAKGDVGPNFIATLRWLCGPGRSDGVPSHLNTTDDEEEA